MAIFLPCLVGWLEGSGWCEMFTAVWILYAVTDSLPCLTLRTNCWNTIYWRSDTWLEWLPYHSLYTSEDQLSKYCHTQTWEVDTLLCSIRDTNIHLLVIFFGSFHRQEAGLLNTIHLLFIMVYTPNGLCYWLKKNNWTINYVYHRVFCNEFDNI